MGRQSLSQAAPGILQAVNIAQCGASYRESRQQKVTGISALCNRIKAPFLFDIMARTAQFANYFCKMASAQLPIDESLTNGNTISGSAENRKNSGIRRIKTIRHVIYLFRFGACPIALRHD